LGEGAAAGVMEHLNWGYLQLGLVALVFGGLQVWWISSVFWKRDLARPQNGGAYQERSPLRVLLSAPHELYSESSVMGFCFVKSQSTRS
jgi:hypothetical protein